MPNINLTNLLGFVQKNKDKPIPLRYKVRNNLPLSKEEQLKMSPEGLKPVNWKMLDIEDQDWDDIHVAMIEFENGLTEKFTEYGEESKGYQSNRYMVFRNIDQTKEARFEYEAEDYDPDQGVTWRLGDLKKVEYIVFPS